MNDEIRQRLQTLRDGLSVQSGQFERLPTAAEIVELIDCVLAVEPVVNNVSITNNRAAVDRVGDSCAKLVAAEERLAQARAVNWGAVRFSLDRRVAKPPQDWSGLNAKRPWWKFWA